MLKNNPPYALFDQVKMIFSASALAVLTAAMARTVSAAPASNTVSNVIHTFYGCAFTIPPFHPLP